MTKTITLVNANEMHPPVGPIGLDYVAAALESQGWEPRLLDLTWETDAERAIAEHFRNERPVLVGLTQRNIDDCYMASQYSCLPHARAMVELLRAHTDAPIVLGGCGFSVMPETLLEEIGADYGIAGDGEEALALLAHAVYRRESVGNVPGLVYRDGGATHANARSNVDLAAYPLSRRGLIDNARYWREGGQGGFETKRGCPGTCRYCADPLAKGRQVRLRDPQDVAREVCALAAQGVVHLHTCDAEFNLPRSHALAVCDALIAAGIPGRVQWWAYCAPQGFDDELARQMSRAGCVGVDFGADHGCDEQLARLGREHRVADLERVAQSCHKHGIVFMYDILLGAPGETPATMRQTIALMRRLEPDRVGVSAGLRLCPGTALTDEVVRGSVRDTPGLLGATTDNETMALPVYYIAPEVGPDIARIVNEMVGDDPRFLCPEADVAAADYNYRDNPTLAAAIQAGERGAYWDVLRRQSTR